MITHPLVPNATDSPLPAGEGLGVRSNLTKQGIEMTMLIAEAMKALLDQTEVL